MLRVHTHNLKKSVSEDFRGETSESKNSQVEKSESENSQAEKVKLATQKL